MSSSETPVPIDETLSGWIARASKAHRARAAALLARLDLHPGQEFLLAALWDRDGQTQAEIARRLEVTPPTINRIAARMEEAGLIERRASQEDSRLARLHLTDAGRAIRPQVEALWADLVAAVTSGLTEAEARELQRLLKIVVRTMSRPGDSAE